MSRIKVINNTNESTEITMGRGVFNRLKSRLKIKEASGNDIPSQTIEEGETVKLTVAAEHRTFFIENEDPNDDVLPSGEETLDVTSFVSAELTLASNAIDGGDDAHDRKIKARRF